MHRKSREEKTLAFPLAEKENVIDENVRCKALSLFCCILFIMSSFLERHYYIYLYLCKIPLMLASKYS